MWKNTKKNSSSAQLQEEQDDDEAMTMALLDEEDFADPRTWEEERLLLMSERLSLERLSNCPLTYLALRLATFCYVSRPLALSLYVSICLAAPRSDVARDSER